jgi:membrane associated rhomboid family serine protease
VSGKDEAAKRGQTLGPPQALWRRALFGPMPLSYPLIAASGLYYALSVVLSIAMSDGSAGSILSFLWAPAQTVLVDMGMGGEVPLANWQIWTLVTSTFLHANLLHIGLNMLCLYMIMPMVEMGFGRLRAFILYGLAGICGALSSALWGELYSLGASGAIFGLFGAMLSYGALRGDATGRRIMIDSAKWAALNFGAGLIAPISVSNAAHFGGFLGGILVSLAMIYRPGLIRLRDPTRAGFWLASLMLLCLAAGAGRGVSSTWQAWTDPQGYVARKNDDLIAQLDVILTDDPNNGQAHAFRAERYLAKEDYAAALPDLDAALAAGIDTPQLRNNRAWSLYKLDRPGDGLADADVAVTAEPENAASLDTRAHIYEALGRRNEAISDYQAALAKDPTIKESQDGLKRLTSGQ